MYTKKNGPRMQGIRTLPHQENVPSSNYPTKSTDENNDEKDDLQGFFTVPFVVSTPSRLPDHASSAEKRQGRSSHLRPG